MIITILIEVTAKRMRCQDDLKQELIKHSGSNSGSTATPAQYCPGHDDSVYWSTTNPVGY